MIAVGLDVGGTYLKAAVVDDGVLVADHTETVPPTDVVDFVAGVGRSLVSEHRAHALGVGVAGLVRWPSGEFVWGPHVSGEGVPYRRILGEAVGVPVVVDNDANLAAYAEAATGAARGAANVIMLTLGTGIGAGLVLDGRIYRGTSFAGEVGHMTIQADGLICACGRRGCWETLVSGGRLDHLASELAAEEPEGIVARSAGSGRPVTAEHLVAAADSGDDRARELLAEAGEWLGRGVANLVAVLDPDVVVVGGAVAQAGGWLLDPARMAIASRLTGARHRGPVRLVQAHHGRMAGSVGAALLAADACHRPAEEPS